MAETQAREHAGSERPPGFQGRLGVVQRVVPPYRIPFFDAISVRCTQGLHLYAGYGAAREALASLPERASGASVTVGKNLHLGRRRPVAWWQRGLKDWFDAARVDLVVVEANPRNLSMLPLLRHARAAGVPVVGWGLGTLHWASPRVVDRVRRGVLARFYLSFDGMIAYSEKGLRDYLGYGFPAARAFVARNAVIDVPRELPDTRERQVWREARAVEGPAVVFVGRLIREKRVEDLIRAVAMAGVHLLVVGEGPDSARLQALARELGTKVTFLGEIRGPELALPLRAADLFVLPGAGGLALQEALAHGLPAVATIADGTETELVIEGRNGHIVPSGDPRGLADTIATCLADPERLKRMGVESRRLVQERFSLDAMTRSFVTAAEAVRGMGPRKRPR